MGDGLCNHRYLQNGLGMISRALRPVAASTVTAIFDVEIRMSAHGRELPPRRCPNSVANISLKQ